MKRRKDDDEKLLEQLGYIVKAFGNEPIQITILAQGGKLTIGSVDKLKTDEEDDDMPDMPTGAKNISTDMTSMAKNMRNKNRINYIG